MGFVGLGVMGEAMAGHLLKAGAELTVYNRTRFKAEALEKAGAAYAEMADLAEACDAILLCVSRSEDVAQCIEAMGAAKAGTLFIDHSTIEPAVAEKIHGDLAKQGKRFVDAPVTGGSMGAQKGQLTIFMGGEENDFAEAREIIAPYTKRAERVGGPGAGQKAKLVNQIAGAGALLALCESLSFAKKAGLDLPQIISLVGSGAAGSWAFDNYGGKILARDWSPGFTVENQRKDLGYCEATAAELGAAVPGTKLVNSLLALLEAKGHGDWTTAALYEAMLELGA